MAQRRCCFGQTSPFFGRVGHLFLSFFFGGVCVAQASNDIYSGTWVANKKHGDGMYQFGADESTLHGTWVDGTITEGKLVFKVL